MVFQTNRQMRGQLQTYETKSQTIIERVLHPFFFPMRQSLTLAAQVGVQWHDLGSLQPSPPGFK